MTDLPDLPRGRQLSRNETHDLGMIIKDRTKVLKAHAEEQASTLMADFERNLAAIYSWDQDEIWKDATEEARRVVEESQRVIAQRCVELGIPAAFAPSIGMSWQGRGENALAQRRAELRRVAKAEIEAMTKAAMTRIEKQALDLRTQVVAMGVLSDEARTFLMTLTPIEDSMRGIDFANLERKIDERVQRRLADRNRAYDGDY